MEINVYLKNKKDEEEKLKKSLISSINRAWFDKF